MIDDDDIPVLHSLLLDMKSQTGIALHKTLFFVAAIIDNNDCVEEAALNIKDLSSDDKLNVMPLTLLTLVRKKHGYKYSLCPIEWIIDTITSVVHGLIDQNRAVKEASQLWQHIFRDCNTNNTIHSLFFKEDEPKEVNDIETNDWKLSDDKTISSN